MKRCPQCEFIYEDDQSLCDMDGVLLVLDSRILPNVHALTLPARHAGPKRKRTVPAFATLILALVLGMVYYVSTQLNAPRDTGSPATATNPAPVSQPPALDHPAPAPEAIAASSDEKKDQPKPAAVKTSAPVKQSAAKTNSTSQIKPATEQKKEESKVGSILKKTGRILKKPFKF